MIVKPLCLPCKYSPQFCQEVLVADDGEFLTILVGSALENSDFLFSVFGASSTAELKLQQTLPQYVPAEASPEAEMFSAFIEQLRYERSDGAPKATRVIISDQAGYQQERNDIFREDSSDKNTDFSYPEFLSMLHKRIRAKASEQGGA